jgi:hypothetical protein
MPFVQQNRPVVVRVAALAASVAAALSFQGPVAALAPAPQAAACASPAPACPQPRPETQQRKPSQCGPGLPPCPSN